MRWKDRIGLGGVPQFVVSFIGIVAQKDFFGCHPEGVKLGNNRGCIGLGLEGEVSGRLVEPLFP